MRPVRRASFQMTFLSIRQIYKKRTDPQRAGLVFLLLLKETQVLDVNRFLLCDTLLDGRLLEILAGAHLADCTRLLELALELFKGALDIFAFFNLYDDHSFITPFFIFGPQRYNSFA